MFPQFMRIKNNNSLINYIKHITTNSGKISIIGMEVDIIKENIIIIPIMNV